MGRGLSTLQIDILKWLHEQQDAFSHTIGAAWFSHWGTPWKGDASLTNSERAVASRALRRLEQRGLVLRNNGVSGSPGTGKARTAASDPHNRTTNVRITDAGRALVQSLSAK